MKVVVDGIIFEKQHKGGISRIYQEVFPRMCGMEGSLDVNIVTNRSVKGCLPDHPAIKHTAVPEVGSFLRPWRLWKPFIPTVQKRLCSFYIGLGKNSIWHSTYYTLPDRWLGAQVVLVVDMIHELYAEEYFHHKSHDFFRDRKKESIYQADAIICISETTRRDLLNIYSIDSSLTYTVPLAHSDIFRILDKDKIEFQPTENAPFILYVGRRHGYKNFTALLDAYSQWRYRKDFKLVVVGKDWNKKERQQLGSLNLNNNVTLLMNIDDWQLSQLYNQATAFVYPSLYEGFGIPLLEALACGCPLIASSIPSTIEVAGSCAIYFDPQQSDSLLDALDRAILTDLPSEQIQRGIERADKFSWDNTAKEMLEVYQIVC